LTEIHLHHAGCGQETLRVQTARQGPGKSEVIIRQGDLQADYFYVIAQGKVGARPYRCAAAASTPRPPLRPVEVSATNTCSPGCLRARLI
jgi:hypothetical protein